jgi:hypothetical protein
MRWVFPTLGRDFAACTPATAYDGKIRAVGCTVDSGLGRSARVVYSEWRTFELGDAHYRRKYGSPDAQDAQFNIWSTTRVSGKYESSRMFASGLPFSLTVASGSQEATDAVMRRLRFRSPAETKQYR